MVLRRLAGEMGDTAPVVTLVTQFGGGKTHTLTTLDHLANSGSSAASFPGVAELLKDARLPEAPNARVGVFVGNRFDPDMRLRAEAGYGFEAFRGRGAVAPFVGLTSGASSRDLRAGVFWSRGEMLRFGIEAMQRESQEGLDRSVLLRATARW